MEAKLVKSDTRLEGCRSRWKSGRERAGGWGEGTAGSVGGWGWGGGGRVAFISCCRSYCHAAEEYDYRRC